MFWGSFWPGLEGMTEVAEPDADLFRMYIPDIVILDPPVRDDVLTGMAGRLHRSGL